MDSNRLANPPDEGMDMAHNAMLLLAVLIGGIATVAGFAGLAYVLFM